MEGAKQRFLSASERGGVIQGFTPIHSHVQLYLVQIILIVVMCFVLGQLVKKWHQPRVIAEVSGRDAMHYHAQPVGFCKEAIAIRKWCIIYTLPATSRCCFFRRAFCVHSVLARISRYLYFILDNNHECESITQQQRDF